MKSSDRQKAAVDDALCRLEEEAQRSQRRLESAVEKVFAKVAAIVAGTLRPEGDHVP